MGNVSGGNVVAVSQTGTVTIQNSITATSNLTVASPATVVAGTATLNGVAAREMAGTIAVANAQAVIDTSGALTLNHATIVASNAVASGANVELAVLPNTITLAPGWNLVGNSYDTALEVATAFSNPAGVISVWKWIPGAAGRWAYYTPSLTGQTLADYAAARGYDVLTTINGGEGFWVNAASAVSVTLPPGPTVPAAVLKPRLAAGWNLVSMSEVKTPGQFNVAMGTEGATSIPSNVNAVWAWDNASLNWYFYAPSLDANGSLASFIAGRGYRDFLANGKTLGHGTGFWVNKP
jgi:hypothetical protein